MDPILRPYEPSGDRDFLFRIFAAAGPALELAALPESPLKAALIQQQFLAWLATYQQQFGLEGLSIIESPAGSPVGYIWLHRTPEEHRIADLAFSPEVRGKGLGSIVVKHIAAQAMADGRPLRASVAKSNEGSLRFNLRLGYVVTHETPTHWAIEWRGQSNPA
jgi:ribosomal protein S18 acetylase RimI-like enzyme